MLWLNQEGDQKGLAKVTISWQITLILLLKYVLKSIIVVSIYSCNKIIKGLIRLINVQYLARPIIHFAHTFFDLVRGYLYEISVLGEKLPDKSIGIFVGSTFPR